MSDLVIARMALEDVDQVSRIQAASFPAPWPEGSFRREVEENSCARYLVAREEGRVLGYAGAWLVLDEAHVTTMAVDPEARGRRLGTRLFWHLMELVVAEGSRWATLEVWEENEPALRIYRAFGFSQVGVRRGYYADGTNALVMWAGDLQKPRYRRRLDDLRKAWEGAHA